MLHGIHQTAIMTWLSIQLANHGYISRNGVVNPLDVTLAANSVLGMGLDLAGLLTTMSVVFGGSPLSLPPLFSIAGQDKAVGLALNGLLGLTGKCE
jgi:hypothetical protein